MSNSKKRRPRQLLHWDSEARVLLLHGQVIRELNQPATNQEEFIEGCELQGWKKNMKCPLKRKPSESDAALKVRLHNTMHDFNRSLLDPLLHIRGDGTGLGIRLDFLQPSQDGPQGSKPTHGRGGKLP